MKLLKDQGTPILRQLHPLKIQCAGASSIVDMQWHEFDDPYAAVRRDWWYVQNHPAIRAEDKKIDIHGFVYDPATGGLEDVPPRLPPSENSIPGSQPNGGDGADCGRGAGEACG